MSFFSEISQWFKDLFGGPIPAPVPPPPPPPPPPKPTGPVVAWINEANLAPSDLANIVAALNVQALAVGINGGKPIVTHVVATDRTVPTGATPAYFLTNADVAGDLKLTLG